MKSAATNALDFLIEKPFVLIIPLAARSIEQGIISSEPPICQELRTVAVLPQKTPIVAIFLT